MKRVCKSCGSWDNCPACDEGFQADQLELRQQQLALDCGDESFVLDTERLGHMGDEALEDWVD